MEDKLIYKIIDRCKEFELETKSHRKNDLQNFSRWLFEKEHQEETISKHENAIFEQHEISRYITYLFRYAKNYSKIALNNTSLVSLDDFVFLATLHRVPSLTKMELIEMHVIEKATGIQVIKRLAESNLILEQQDKIDKRSTRISLSKKGEKVITNCYENMQIISQLIAGDLTIKEQKELFILLKKLDDFHKPIYKDVEFGDMEYLKNSIPIKK